MNFGSSPRSSLCVDSPPLPGHVVSFSMDAASNLIAEGGLLLPAPPLLHQGEMLLVTDYPPLLPGPLGPLGLVTVVTMSLGLSLTVS